MSGILNKFRREPKSLPVPPVNILADFAAGSTHLYSQILQARIIAKPMTVIDCSLAHSTFYLSQLELLREVQFSSLTRSKSKQGVVIQPFIRPHDLVFQDKGGLKFVLRQESQIYKRVDLQHFNDEEWHEAKVLGDTMQFVFDSMSLDQIEKEYGKVELVRELGSATENHIGGGKVSNVFGDLVKT